MVTSRRGKVVDGEASHAGRRPAAFTLLELLLSVALVVAAASLAVPAFLQGLASTRLRRGADQVLGALMETRRQAIDDGTPMQFRWESPGAEYRIETWLPASGRESGRPESVTAPSTAKDDLPSPLRTQKLPEGAEFVQQQAIASAQAAESTGARGQLAGTAQADGWATPIVFFPDGSATDATILVGSPQPLFVRIAVRGLTGVARASRPLTQGELDNLRRGK